MAEDSPRNPIDRETFKKIREHFGWCSSWAVWSPAVEGAPARHGIGDISHFREEHVERTLKLLHADVIFVGLNFARDPDQEAFANFHSPLPHGQDYKLRHALQGTRNWGAYLTDIIKGCVEVNSTRLMAKLREDPNLEKENAATFLEEICMLGAKDPLIVALGGAAHTVLQRNFKGKFRIVHAWHYSAYVNPDNYREQVLSSISAAPNPL